ncbi:hypothetical protein [Solicola sp. PLA-1-18]|uniref:hypothetical protein n=1 Tax=Solicola sp. PLA-1-18 TaxID=3380532 RepID=UPI003B7E4011
MSPMALLGPASTGAVITSAGPVLAGTFAVLVTALTLDVGRHLWWPSRLGRDDGPPAAADADAERGRQVITP